MSVSIAMVPIHEGGLLLAPAIEKELRELWPSAPEFDKGSDFDADASDSDVIGFSTDDVHIFFAPMPAPIPSDDIEAVLEATYLWPDAEQELRGHTSHVIVTVMTELPDIERLRILTVATAALVATCEQAPGVFWCDAFMFVSGELFIEFAKAVMPDTIPLLLWVNFRVGEGPPGKTVGCTKGLQSLGHMELETINSPEPFDELRDRLIGLADYLLENGPVIRDGDTVGESANERIKVVYSDSEFGNEEKVMQLDYEGASPKKTSFWKKLMGRREKNP